MSKLFKVIIPALLAVILTVGGLRAVDFSSYKLSYDTARWNVNYNALVTAAETELNALNASVSGLASQVTNWIGTVDSLTLIQTTPTYSAANTLILAGDYSSLLTAGKRLVADCGADGLQPNTVVSCTYAAPNSTVVVTTANLTANLAAVSYYATRNGVNTYGSGDIVAGEFGAPSWANLSAAAGLANSSGRRLLLTPGTWPVTDDLAITASVLPVPGALLEVATTKTLTLSYAPEAGRWKIFTWAGTGTVAYGASVPEVFPEWYGSLADGTTDSTTYLQKALDTHTVLHLGGGIYRTTTELYPKENATIYGEGPQSIIYRSTTTGGSYAGGLCPYNYVTLRNFTLRGSGAAYVAGANGLIILYDNAGWTDPGGVVARDQANLAKWRGAHLNLENLVIENWAATGLGAGPWSVIKDVVIKDTLCSGMLLAGDHTQIINPNVRNCPGWGIDICASYVTVQGGYLYNCGDETAWPGDMGGIIIASHTQAAGAVGNKVTGTTINTSDGPGVIIYAPTGVDYALTDTVLDSLTIKNVNVDAAGDVAAVIVSDLSTSGTKIDRVNMNNLIVDTVTTGHGISVWGARNVNIDNYHIKGVPGAGLFFYTGTGAWEGINVGQGTIKSFGTHGIKAINGSKLTVAGCNLSDSTAIEVYFGVLLEDVTQFNLERVIIDLDVTNGYGIYLTGATGNGLVSGANIANCLSGIYYDATGDYVNLLGNDLSDTVTTPLYRGGTHTTVLQANNLGVPVPDYANNAAAVAAGLPVNESYRITGADTLATVH